MKAMQHPHVHEDEVEFEVREGVAIITLNRPGVHNALNDAMRAALTHCFEEVRRRDEVRAVLLRGRGKSFCSGRDTKGFVDPAHGASHSALIATAQQVRRRQLGCGKPMVCAIQGHAIGAGAELALGCDMRIAARDMKFSLPEVPFGLVADTGSSTLLTALVGPARAKWILLSGLPVAADEALQWGLVEWTVEPEALEQKSLELAATLASRPVGSVRRQKQLIDVQFEQAVETGLVREMAAQLALFDSGEYEEAKKLRERKAAH
ncbi:enoyl-CoA hydratase/isomerase family protein [Alcaligenaceae bacterium]|nr:enoyl-CoA hydratase/isomerase family protein [Alcaligenaceae bacterium]